MIDPVDDQSSPAPSEQDVLRGLASDVYGDQNNAVIRSMSVATKQNPDLAAQAQQLGTATGVGADVASRNIEEVRRQQQLDQIRLKDLARSSPALAAHLSDPSFAAVAHDDVQNLMDSEKMWNGVRMPTGNPVSDVLPTSFWAKVASGFESARIQGEDEGLMRMAKQDPAKFDEAFAQWQTNQQRIQDLPFQAEGWIAGTSNVVGQQVYGLPRVGKSALVGATIGGTVGAVGGLGIFDWATIPAGIMAGGSAGAATAMATNTFGAESANTYFNLRQAGYDDGISTTLAYAVGAVNAGLEMGGLEFSSRLTRKAFSAAVRNIAGEKIGATVAKRTTAAITKETVAKGVRTAVAEGIKGTIAEATEEVSQDLSNFVAERIAYAVSQNKEKLRQPKELQQFISESVDTFYKTIQSTALLQLPGMAAHIHNTYTNVRRAEATAKFMSGLMGKAVESKLRTRSPETFQRFMAAQADGTNAETLYVEASKMEELLDAAELPADEENRLFPGVRAAIAAAKVDGGDISFPTAKFVTELAGTKLGDSMVENMRLDPNAPSLAEAREIAAVAEQQRKEFEAQANKILEDKQQTDADFIESAQVVKDRMRQEVLAAGGFTPEQADELSTMGRNMIVNLAAKAGMTPEQYENEYGKLQIFGEGQQPAAAFQQSAKVNGVVLRKAIREYAKGNIGADELMGEAGLFGLVTEQEVAELLEFDAGLAEAGASSRGGTTSLPGGIERRGEHPLLTLVRKREKERAGFTPAQRMDADYMVAVERGDMEAAQQMVDDAAYQAGYTVRAFHGTDAKPFDIFGNYDAYNFGDASYFSPNQKYAEDYAYSQRTGGGTPRVLNVALKLGKVFSPETNKQHLALYKKWAKEQPAVHGYFAVQGPITEPYGPEGVRNLINWEDQWWLVNKIREAGFDSFTTSESDGETIAYGVLNANQIKLADAVTRDEAGNIVPLSRRFDITSPKVFEQSAVAPEFYSALERSIGAIDANALTGVGWRERLKGLVNKGEIKQDELTWSGLEDFLALPRDGKVTKAEVAAFLKNNGVQVQAVTLGAAERDVAVFAQMETGLASARLDLESAGGMTPELADAFDAYESILENQVTDREQTAALQDQIDAALAENGLTELHGYFEDSSAAQDESIRGPKYGQYTLSGGTNYREILLTLPNDALGTRNIMESDKVVAIAKNEPFRSSHWDHPNVVAHIRVNDRVDANNKRILFVEEIQSDWAQQGRKKGFDGEVRPATEEDVRLIMHQVFGFTRGDAITDMYGWDTLATVVNDPENAGDLIADAGWSQAQADKFLRLARERRVGVGIPVAPFVTKTEGWLNLALKQIMLEAIKGNYDSVAFINGEQSADRYDLSKQIDSIVYRKNGDRTYDIEAIKGSSVLVTKKNEQASQIEELLGKEITQRIVNGDGEQTADYPSEYKELSGLDLKVGGEGMEGFYDKIVPAAVNKLLKKVDGEKLGTVEIDLRTPESEAWYREPTAEELLAQPGFNVTADMRETVSGGLPLFQAAAGGARGAFDPRSLTLMLNKGADMSTFPHEMAHFYLTMLNRMASSATADPSARADMDLTLSWFGVAGATPEERIANWNAMSVDQQRQYHEQFAYNFELYLFEGKSPSLEMQGVFDRFAAYLKRVYKSIRDELNATYKAQFGRDLPFLTPEIRGVMDRMLASDEQIKRAEAIRNMMPMFQTQEQAGMSDTEWAAYQAMQSEATQASITDLSRASIRQMQWLSNARSRILREMQAEHEERRKEIKSEVSKEVAARPVYRAMRWFRSGEFEQADGTVVKTEGDHKINKTLAFEIIDAQPRETMIDYLNLPTGIFSEEGANPDEVAQMMGFTSGDQMLRGLVSVKPMREEIDAETDKRLTAERGELNTPEAREAAISSALHNQARARFVATELRFVAKATQPVRVMLEAARQVAAQIIGDKKLRDLKPNEFMAAESRAAKDASNAYSKEGAKDRKARYGNVSPEEVVVAAKRAQLMQNQLAAEATRVGGEVVKAVKYLRNVLSDASRKRMGADAADQIANILERFELRPMSRDEALRRATLATWITAQRDAGLEPDISPEVENEAFRVSYRDLTVQQFRDVVDAIKQIEYVAKNAQKLLVAARRAEFEATRDEIVASIETHAGDRKAVTRTPTTKLGKTLSALKGFAASHLKAAAIVRILDGGVDGGPLWQYLIRTSNERSDMETTMRAEATKFLSELFAPLFKMGRMGGAGVYFPSIDRSLNREARIAIALNMGNAGNIQRLLDGEGWTMEQIQPVLESLTQAEWDVVQGVWDYMESYRPKIAEKERRIYGKEPAWVEPQALTVKTAEGNEITLRGGYYPIKYDPMASMRAETMAEADEARRDLKAAGIAATTRRSFTKARVREVTGRPLMYSLVGMYSGINDVIHDLSWHEWLIDANRLMRSDKFDNAVRTKYGPDYVRQLKDWIKDVAAGESQVTSEGERMLSWMRQNVSAAGLGFNIVSAAMQPTGFANSIVRVGPAWVGRGIAATISNPKRAYAMVADKSEFMRNRSRTQFRELNELRNMVQDQSRADRTWRSGVYFLMMRMQQVVDNPTWIGAYEKALADGREEVDAVALADQAVIDSQGGGQLKDLSKIERGGPGLKLFTVFYSFMNTLYNQSKVVTMTEKNKGKLAAKLIMLWVVPVVLNRMLKDALTPGDDNDDYWRKLPRRLAEDQLSYFMGSMVGLREFSEVAKTVTGGKSFGYEGPSGLRKVGDVLKFAEQASQGEFDTAFRKTAINLIGDLSGAPSAQINRMIDGIDALVEGKTSNPLAPLTGFAKNR